MKRSKLFVLPLLFAMVFSLSGCALFANQFVRSILIFVGRSVGETIIIQITEKFLDKYIFGTELVDEATSSVNTLYDQVKPLPHDMRSGHIPGKDSMAFQVNGELRGVSNQTTIKIAHSQIHFQRESTGTDKWILTSFSEGMIRNRLNVAAAQISLQNRGFQLQERDGIVGPQTARALKAFQQSRGLVGTGELDNATKDILLTQ